jgi:hypothetical protein
MPNANASARDAMTRGVLPWLEAQLSHRFVLEPWYDRRHLERIGAPGVMSAQNGASCDAVLEVAVMTSWARRVLD